MGFLGEFVKAALTRAPLVVPVVPSAPSGRLGGVLDRAGSTAARRTEGALARAVRPIEGTRSPPEAAATPGQAPDVVVGFVRDGRGGGDVAVNGRVVRGGAPPFDGFVPYGRFVVRGVGRREGRLVFLSFRSSEGWPPLRLERKDGGRPTEARFLDEPRAATRDVARVVLTEDAFEAVADDYEARAVDGKASFVVRLRPGGRTAVGAREAVTPYDPRAVAAHPWDAT